MKGVVFSSMCMFFVFSAGCAHRPKMIAGETCIRSANLRVLQVLDDGILAYLCPVHSDSWYDCVMEGDTVFMSVARAINDYVDQQKIALPKTQCFVRDGVFRYPRKKDGVIATVRKIKILEESSLISDIK